jgi:hypothetical protein
VDGQSHIYFFVYTIHHLNNEEVSEHSMHRCHRVLLHHSAQILGGVHHYYAIVIDTNSLHMSTMKTIHHSRTQVICYTALKDWDDGYESNQEISDILRSEIDTQLLAGTFVETK